VLKTNPAHLKFAPVTIIFCLFFFSEIGLASSVYVGPLLGIRSFPTGPNFVYINVDVKNIDSPPNCMDTGIGYQYVINTADDPSKTLLSNLQIALSDSTRVAIIGTGKCNTSSSEYIGSANIDSKVFGTYVPQTRTSPQSATIDIPVNESGPNEASSLKQRRRGISE
jgi:hypothetical protein